MLKTLVQVYVYTTEHRKKLEQSLNTNGLEKDFAVSDAIETESMLP